MTNATCSTGQAARPGAQGVTMQKTIAMLLFRIELQADLIRHEMDQKPNVPNLILARTVVTLEEITASLERIDNEFECLSLPQDVLI